MRERREQEGEKEKKWPLVTRSFFLAKRARKAGAEKQEESQNRDEKERKKNEARKIKC